MVFVICEGQTKHSLVSVHLGFQVTQKRVFHKLLKKISNMGKSYDHWIRMLISLLSSVAMFVCSFACAFRRFISLISLKTTYLPLPSN